MAKASHAELCIGIAEKFFSARRALQSLCRDEYATRIVRWKTLVRKVCDHHKCSLVQAAMKIIEQEPTDGPLALWVLSATIDLIEEGEGDAKTT